MASNTGTVGTTGHMREGGAGPTTSDSRPGHLHEGGAQPGVHHSEGGVAPTTTHHTKGAVVAPTTHHESEDVGVTKRSNRGEGVLLNTGARVGLALSQLLTIIAFLIVLGALSALQKRANALLLPARQALAYTETFQSAGYQPYPNAGHDQFGFQWFILAMEIFVFFVIAILIMLPRTLLRLKHIAMAFLVYVFVLTTLQIPSLLYFNRSSTSRALYGGRKIKVALAGAIIGAIANAMSIIFLGLLRDTHKNHRRNTSAV